MHCDKLWIVSKIEWWISCIWVLISVITWSLFTWIWYLGYDCYEDLFGQIQFHPIMLHCQSHYFMTTECNLLLTPKFIQFSWIYFPVPTFWNCENKIRCSHTRIICKINLLALQSACTTQCFYIKICTSMEWLKLFCIQICAFIII